MSLANEFVNTIVYTLKTIKVSSFSKGFFEIKIPFSLSVLEVQVCQQCHDHPTKKQKILLNQLSYYHTETETNIQLVAWQQLVSLPT